MRTSRAPWDGEFDKSVALEDNSGALDGGRRGKEYAGSEGSHQLVGTDVKKRGMRQLHSTRCSSDIKTRYIMLTRASDVLSNQSVYCFAETIGIGHQSRFFGNNSMQASKSFLLAVL